MQIHMNREKFSLSANARNDTGNTPVTNFQNLNLNLNLFIKHNKTTVVDHCA